MASNQFHPRHKGITPLGNRGYYIGSDLPQLTVGVNFFIDAFSWLMTDHCRQAEHYEPRTLLYIWCCITFEQASQVVSRKDVLVRQCT